HRPGIRGVLERGEAGRHRPVLHLHLPLPRQAGIAVREFSRRCGPSRLVQPRVRHGLRHRRIPSPLLAAQLRHDGHPRGSLLLPRHRGSARAVEADPRTGTEARHVHPRRRVLAHRVHPLWPAPRPQHRRPPRMRRDPMSTPVRRIVIIAVLGLALLAGAAWAIFGLTSGGEEEDGPGTAVMPSDGGETGPSDGGGPSDDASASPSDDADQIEVTGDYTDPEQVALAFATTYPGDV